jgi:hypothetical protein
MKAIVSIGVILLVAFGIFAVLSLMQREATDKLVQEDASGFFRENKLNAEAARGDNPEKIFPPRVKYGPSWLDHLQNATHDYLRGIKNLPTSLTHLVRPHKQKPAGAENIAGGVAVAAPTAFTEGQVVSAVLPLKRSVVIPAFASLGFRRNRLPPMCTRGNRDGSSSQIRATRLLRVWRDFIRSRQM